jgi:hypothetical protein
VKRRYQKEFDGVLVSYTDPKLEGDALGVIVDDLPNLHALARAKAVVFRPRPGDALIAVVTSQSASHLGGLICGTFNAAVAVEDMSEACEFDVETNQWCVAISGEHCGACLAVWSRRLRIPKRVVLF